MGFEAQSLRFGLKRSVKLDLAKHIFYVYQLISSVLFSICGL